MRGYSRKIKVILLLIVILTTVYSCNNSKDKKEDEFLKQHAQGFDHSHQNLLNLINGTRSSFDASLATLLSVDGDVERIKQLKDHINIADSLMQLCGDMYSELSKLTLGSTTPKDTIWLLGNYQNEKYNFISYPKTSVSKVEVNFNQLKNKLITVRNTILARVFEVQNTDHLEVQLWDQINWSEITTDTSILDDVQYIVECFPIAFENNRFDDLSALEQYEYLRMAQSKMVRALYRGVKGFKVNFYSLQPLNLLIGLRNKIDSTYFMVVENHYDGVYFDGIAKYKIKDKTTGEIICSGVDTIKYKETIKCKLTKGVYLADFELFWEDRSGGFKFATKKSINDEIIIVK